MQLRFNGIQSTAQIMWAFQCIEQWIAGHDPAPGNLCAFSQGDWFGSAKKTPTGVTFTFTDGKQS